ncbi:hemicentin-2 [Salmo salar]|uniref:Hemicentin-2 n=1 Tax=Salmo salar TaxID=8030 RepID=A0ABM3DCP7_SALSA|nr:hemicentin-2-like [Salmo salar]
MEPTLLCVLLLLNTHINSGHSEDDDAGVAKAVLTIHPNSSQIFSGESVTLRCDIQGGGVTDWEYRWLTPSPDQCPQKEHECIISVAEFSHSGDYSCLGSHQQQDSKWSDAVRLTVTPLPKATLTVEPNPVFPGETVTLTCSVGSDSIRNYQWYKDRNDNVVSQSVRHTITGDTLTISRAAESDQGLYWCQGEIQSRSISSIISDHVTITVNALPSASLKIVTPQGLLYPGETVTLQCDISEYTDWTYRWFRYKKELPIQTRKTITISLPDQAGQYRCVGRRRGRPQKSYYSSALPIIITALPETTVTVNPNPVYTGETVTLTCSAGSYSDWSYKWYKDNSEISLSQYKYLNTRSTISRVTESDQGLYWCQGERRSRPTSSSISDAVTVTVNTGDVILESPVHPVTEGDSVTLTCCHICWNNRTKAQHGVLIKNETTGEMTIPTVSKSDEGFYKCKSGQGESPETWVTVRVPPGSVVSISLTRLLCFLLVMSPFLLVSIVLTVKCCRARGLCSTVTSPQDQIPCDDVIEQNESSV